MDLVKLAAMAMKLEPQPTRPNLGNRMDWISPRALLVMLPLMAGLAIRFTQT